MKPYYDREGITIYHGDCREVLSSLPDSMADAVVTDPPYNAINRVSGGLRSFDKGTADSAVIDIPRLASEFLRVSRGSIYVWCSDEQYTAWTMAFKESGITTRICAWWKSNPSPMNGQHLWLSALELCVFARKNNATFFRHCAAPIWKGPSEQIVGHPTPKPVWLVREQIEASVAPGGIVLDPFAGSGSTLRAAKDAGCRAIGIEIEERYCEIAARRLEQSVLPFAAPTEPAVTETPSLFNALENPTA